MPVTAVFFLLVALFSFQLSSRSERSSRRPNVVLIITDDQGYGDLGLHGNDRIKTPNLDRLGRESVRLTRFYVSPVCAPTRASLMTGRYNYRTGVVDTFLGRALMYNEEVTLAEMLRGAGYRTGIFGKWHLGDNHPLRAIDQGFQEALVCTGGGLTQPSDPEGNSYFDPILQHNGRPGRYQGYCTDIFTRAAIDFIRQNRARPFFAYLATNAPHTPLQVSDKYVEPYLAMGLNETTARIYGMVANIDENVGRLLDELRSLDLQDNTIVVWMTDNGPQQQRYNAGLRGLKGSVYDGGIHVPCFVRWPGRLKPGAVDAVAAHIDLAPTLLAACSVRRPAGIPFDGSDLMPLLRGENISWPERTLYFQWHRGDQPELYRNSAARSSRFKLVDGKELYDLVADPGEQKDIAADHAGIVNQMRRDYERWFRDVSATRGYDPPRIDLGSKQENPVTLTRQDWRGPRAGWNPDSLGYWEVNVAEKASYRIRLEFAAAKTPVDVHLRISEIDLKKTIDEGTATALFSSVPLKNGPARFEAWTETPGRSVGVKYAYVQRAGRR
ncbi:MAG TPA: arylsulfatase [Acidobacteriota bacterium]|jgi:arylsulfatase A-like enzyme